VHERLRNIKELIERATVEPDTINPAPSESAAHAANLHGNAAHATSLRQELLSLVHNHPIANHPLPRLFGAPDTQDARRLIQLFAHLFFPLVSSLPGYIHAAAGRLVALRLAPQTVEQLLAHSPWTSPKAGTLGQCEAPLALYRRFLLATGAPAHAAGLTQLEQRAYALRQRLVRLAEADRPGVAIGGWVALELARAYTGPMLIAGMTRHHIMRPADMGYFEGAPQEVLDISLDLVEAMAVQVPGAGRAVLFGATQALAIVRELFDIITHCSHFPS
jgi:hypothetical protein